MAPDESYHYPADVFELLVEVIPYICKSKMAVVDFFRGAGVPEQFLADWRTKLRSSANDVKKAHISRAIVGRLNEGGDAMLGPRRELIKRVSAFEDFSACWENDRFKAEALVNRVQKLVNVKDSFTRMTLETEKAKRHQQGQHLATLAAKQKATNEREEMKAQLYALFGMTDPKKRGKALEGVLNRLFASHGLTVREAFTVANGENGPVMEQIDGAIELDGHIYVVEMKWLKVRVSTELGQHAARVMVRPPDVRALYISASGFTDAAIQIAKEFLGHRLCVLIELQEIVDCIEKTGDLKELLKAKISRAQTHKEVLYRPPA